MVMPVRMEAGFPGGGKGYVGPAGHPLAAVNTSINPGAGHVRIERFDETRFAASLHIPHQHGSTPRGRF